MTDFICGGYKRLGPIEYKVWSDMFMETCKRVMCCNIEADSVDMDVMRLFWDVYCISRCDIGRGGDNNEEIAL